MGSKEAIITVSRDFLVLNSTPRMIRWVMVLFLLFCCVPQKTTASIINYTDRQVRNIKYHFENSNSDFPKGSEKRGRKKKIKKRMFGRIVKYIVDHPRSTHQDVAAYLKDEYKLEVSVKTIERELGEYDLSDLYKLIREKEKRTVHVNYAGGWLLAPFIADLVKKISPAFKGKHPRRGKAMRSDKLFYIFELTKKRLLGFKPQQGDAILAKTSLKMMKELISKVEPKYVRLILDAGGCKGSVIARLSKIEGLIFLVRDVKLHNLIKLWNKIPKKEYKEYTDPGDPKKNPCH